MLHRAVQLLVLVCEVHGRGTHIPADGHELMHNPPHALLLPHESTQLPTRHRVLAHHSTAHAPHDVPLHCIALATSL